MIGLTLDEYRSRRDIELRQLRRLRALLELAVRAPYYRDAFARAALTPSDVTSMRALGRVPVLQKGDVRDAGVGLYTSPALPSCPDAPLEVRTTGSTGAPLSFRIGRHEMEEEWSWIMYGFYRSGARLSDTFANIEVPIAPRTPMWLERLGVGRRISIDLRCGPRATAETLRAHQPAVIYSYPSVLSLLATDILSSRPLSYSPRLLVTHGEVLTLATRDSLRTAFHAPVRDTYGCTECFRIAFECSAGRYHVLPRAAIIEVDANTVLDDGSGELLLTSFTRHLMPLIRYRLGDRGILALDSCPCGCRFPALLSIAGRADDFLTMPSGRRLSARALNVLEAVPGLLEYQILQKTRRSFVVLARTNLTFGSASVTQIENAIRSGCAPDEVAVSIERVAHVPRTPNGKLRAVVSEVDT